MTRRRVVPIAAGMAFALLAGIFVQGPAGAQTASKTQEEPGTIWDFPNTDLFMDGMGTWVYVAPQPATGPGQLSRGGYQYLLSFVFPQLRIGLVGLATGTQGPVARLAVADLFTDPTPIGAEISYDWSPGKFYFVYVRHLPGNTLGGWVMDWQTGVWTFIGSVHLPGDWGRMVSDGKTFVNWSADHPRPADCRGYPRTDAYFFPLLGFTGDAPEIGTFIRHHTAPGDCPTQSDRLDNGWVHHGLGAATA